jgi:hypothetical protein
MGTFRVPGTTLGTSHYPGRDLKEDTCVCVCDAPFPIQIDKKCSLIETLFREREELSSKPIVTLCNPRPPLSTPPTPPRVFPVCETLNVVWSSKEKENEIRRRLRISLHDLHKCSGSVLPITNFQATPHLLLLLLTLPTTALRFAHRRFNSLSGCLHCRTYIVGAGISE